MKKNYIMLLAALSTALILAGCQNEEPFDTQAETDYPQILKPYNESGTGSFTYELANPDTPLLDSCVVTPSRYTTVNWYLDGVLVHTGVKIEKTFLAGKYALLIEAVTTAGQRTERRGTVIVHPYEFDPYSEATGWERHIAPGVESTITGQHLDHVSHLFFSTGLDASAEGIEVEPTYQEEGLLKYITPDLADGTYFVRLKDAEGKLYGANQAVVHNGAAIHEGYEEFAPGTSWTMTGLNLSDVQSVQVGDVVIKDVTTTSTTITLTAPALEDGTYDLSMKTADGKEVVFCTEDGTQTKVTTKVSKETTLWEGNQDIDWNADLVKLTADEMKDVPAGATIRVYFVLDTKPGYYAFRITTPWWGDDNDATANFVCRIDGAIETSPFDFEWTAFCKELIEERGAMCVLGAGYTIQKITWK